MCCSRIFCQNITFWFVTNFLCERKHILHFRGNKLGKVWKIFHIRRTSVAKTQQVINNFSSKRVQDHATSGSFLFPPWVVDEKYGLDQSEAASHTMRHELSLPPFPFPFAFDQWKNSVTDEEESSERLRDPVHITLITCCVFATNISVMLGLWGSTCWLTLERRYTFVLIATNHSPMLQM